MWIISDGTQEISKTSSSKIELQRFKTGIYVEMWSD